MKRFVSEIWLNHTAGLKSGRLISSRECFKFLNPLAVMKTAALSCLMQSDSTTIIAKHYWNCFAPLLHWEETLRRRSNAPWPNKITMKSEKSPPCPNSGGNKRAVSQKGDFGECALVPVFGRGEHPNVPSSLFLVQVNIRMYPCSCFGTAEHPPKPLFWKPPVCEPLTKQCWS